MLIVVCPSVFFLLVIVLSVLLRYTDSDYSFGISKLFLTVTRWMSLVEPELLTLLESLCSTQVFSWVRITRFLCSVLRIVVCPFICFLLAIVLSVLRYTDSDCPFGIFKLRFSLSDIGNLNRFWLSYLDLWFSCSQLHIIYLVLQSFDFERNWWRLFQKRVVRTKFDIYFYITIMVSIIPLLVDY